jgi:pimeloyl-ACP methyl ester carboxylesterase
MRDWLGAWERPITIEADEFISSGDRILVLVRWSGRGKESGAQMRGREPTSGRFVTAWSSTTASIATATRRALRSRPREPMPSLTTADGRTLSWEERGAMEEMAEALPDSRSVLIPGGDHFVLLEPEDRPAWARAVLDFLGAG